MGGTVANIVKVLVLLVKIVAVWVRIPIVKQLKWTLG